MTCPIAIKNLVGRFQDHLPSYSTLSYNETQLRQEFLNPFFESLGWDVSNKQGHAEAYKEVIHEDAVKIGTATKAPDYSFRSRQEHLPDFIKEAALYGNQSQ